MRLVRAGPFREAVRVICCTVRRRDYIRAVEARADLRHVTCTGGLFSNTRVEIGYKENKCERVVTENKVIQEVVEDAIPISVDHGPGIGGLVTSHTCCASIPPMISE